MSRKSLNNWERGVREPKAVRLYRLARLYKLPMEWFFDGWAGDREEDGKPVYMPVISEGGRVY